MSDDYGHEDEYEALDRAIRRIRIEVLPKAIDAMSQMLQDPRAPAQARSATISSALRAAGGFDRRDEEGEDPLSKLSKGQIEAMLELAYSQREKMRSGKNDDPNLDDIFS